VGDVPVTTDDILARPPAHPAQEVLELVEKAVLRRLARLAGGPGRQVDGGHRETGEDRLEVAALRVELRRAEAPHDALGRTPRVQRDAAVTLLLRLQVMAVVAGRAKHRVGDLVLVGAGFLQAHDIRVLACQPFEEALAGRGADAVGVETDDAHGE
jgi:hypothetical protein